MRSKREREICGTCEFWLGSRKPSLDKGNRPKIDIIDRHACCTSAASQFTGQIRWQNNHCKHYSKWTEIL